MTLHAMINPDLPFEKPGGYVVAGGLVYFLGIDWVQGGHRLCVTDGTIQNTEALVNVVAAMPFEMVEANDHVFFVADTEDYGYQLWVSDGTQGGTAPVTKLGDPAHGAQIQHMASWNGEIYFEANDDSEPQLYRTEHLGGGKYAIVRLTDEASGFNVTELVPGATRLLVSRLQHVDAFKHEYGLYTTNGTQVKHLGDHMFSADENVAFLAHTGELDGWTYFEGGDPLSPTGKTQLWRTDGETTKCLADDIPVPTGTGLKGFSPLGDWMYFIVGETDLWRSDGTEANTVHHADLFDTYEPGASHADAVAADGRGFIVARGPAATGLKFRVYTVAPNGSGTLVREFAADDWSLRRLEPFGDGAVFQFDDFVAYETTLWVSDGTPRGTRPHHTSDNPNENLVNWAAIGDTIYFDEDSPVDQTVTLWVSDGTKPKSITDTGDRTASATFELLDEEGDMAVTVRDGEVPAAFSTTAEFTTSSAAQTVE
ncbi:MAG: hypothetical protein U9R68_09565, partial [Planctomycetota bacterium]|nr:hypothetical protein [Planctomycetota bacterium]